MKFSIGDKIVLKRTGEEGTVAAYINEQMLEVDVNGTVFPVYMDEVDHPYLKWFTEKKKAAPRLIEQVAVEKEKLRPKRLAKGVYLSFMPVFKPDEFEDIVDHVRVYLLNELPGAIQYRYDVKLKEDSLFKHEGNLHGFGHVYLHNIAFDDMSTQPRFHWHLTDATNKDNAAADDILRIRPSKLFEHITELLSKNEPTFSYMLIDDFVLWKKPEPKEKFTPSPKSKIINLKNIAAHTEAARYELDLHIEKLIPTKKGMSNADILKLQLDTLQKYLQLAIMHRQERMVVIHGMGEGVLREAVHKVLKHTKEVEHYVNEYNGRYGFGATEIYFKR